MVNEGSGKLILCVDDEVTGLSVRKMILEAQGYRVLTADNGRDALALFSSKRIDLVVLDYSMPGHDGGRVAESMKKLKPKVPIVMLSAYVDLPRETLAFVDSCVTKGEPPTVLLETILGLVSDNGNKRARSIA
jgi:CheY-like chemotaxis protein